MTYVEACRTTLVEFVEYQKAWAVKQKDEMYLIAKQAWLNQSVKATKGSAKNPRPKFERFDEFYNLADELEQVLNPNYHQNQADDHRVSQRDINRLLNQD